MVKFCQVSENVEYVSVVSKDSIKSFTGHPFWELIKATDPAGSLPQIVIL